jgi:hypothetical protein
MYVVNEDILNVRHNYDENFLNVHVPFIEVQG